MAAMLTGSEQNWRSFTRSVLSMMTEIFKQAMVGIVGVSAAPLAGLSVVARPRPRGQPFRLRRRTSISRPGILREPVANMSLRGLSRGEFVFTKGQPAGWRRKSLPPDAGLCGTGGYVGGARKSGANAAGGRH